MSPAHEMKTWGGDLTPVVSVKEVMHDLIDPLSDNLFDAIGSEVSAKGTRDWAPTTDEEWAKVRVGAVAMAEGVYLLKIPRPIVPPGQENVTEGPDDFTAAEVKDKIEKDPVLWQAKIEALRNVGREVLEIVKSKDTTALSGAVQDLDNACEGCHLEFWYPRQKERMKKLQQLLESSTQQPHKP